MKKWVIRQTGGPEVLELIDIPDPVLQDDEVMVDLKATGINWSEAMIRSGAWPVEILTGFTLGAEGAGVIERVGKAVSRFEIGDRVAVFDIGAYLSDDKGCYAEKCTVAADRVLRLPEEIGFVQAAASPMALLTAYDALINHSPLPESGTVVITACTGSVGIAALQIAKRSGHRVIGTSRSESKKSHITALGAEAVIESDPLRLKNKIAELVGSKGVDYIFDPINGETATQLISLLNLNGTYVNYGALGGADFNVSTGFLFHQVRIHGYVVLRNLEEPAQLQKVWQEVFPLLETKEIVIPVHKKFPFAEAPKAHEALERHAHWGKLVLVQ